MGTSLVAAVIEGEDGLVELSEEYCKLSKERVQHFIDKKKQMEIELKGFFKTLFLYSMDIYKEKY